MAVPCGEHGNQDAVLIASQIEGLLEPGHLNCMSGDHVICPMYGERTYAFAKADRSAKCESAEP